MNPKLFKKQQVVQKPVAKAQEQQLLPEWNNLQQDHNKYKLTNDEVEQRKASRKARPRGQEPIIGDQYLTTQDNSPHEDTEDERDRMINQMVQGLQNKARQQTSSQNTVKKQISNKQEAQYETVVTKKQVKENNQQMENSQEIQNHGYENFKIEPSHLNGTQVDQVNQLIFDQFQQFKQTLQKPLDEVLLQQINKLSKQLNEQQVVQQECVLKIQHLEQENQKLNQEVIQLKQHAQLQQQIEKAQEYQAFEEVLDRLRYV